MKPNDSAPLDAVTPGAKTADVEQFPVKDLRFHPFNEKIYGPDVPQALTASVKECGLAAAIMATSTTKTVVHGTCRTKAAHAAGLETVPVIFIDEPATEEDFEDLIVRYNVGRDKTNEQKSREFAHFLGREIAAVAAAKLAQKGKKSVPKLPPTKSRDVAAAKVGGKSSSLEKGAKVVEAIDKLLTEGKQVEARLLRDVLNKDGFDPALKKGQREGWIPKPDAKVREDKVAGEVVPAEEADQNEAPEPLVAAEPAAPTPVADAVADNPAESHIAALRQLKQFIRGGGADELDDDAKEELSDAFDAVRQALEEAGLIPELVAA